jgi:host factor-I protein
LGEVIDMSDKNQNLQDKFLNKIRKDKISVTVFLMNGVKLQGIITWFDNFSMLLRRDSLSQLIYKHAISTIMPTSPVKLFDDEDDDGVSATMKEE